MNLINNQQFLVSVVIPCYNASATIKETLDAILTQTYQNLEIIICDDKSTDNTVDILKTYSDPRIRLVLNEVNKGVMDNYNIALSSATGMFVKIQCADDLYAADCIEKEVAVFMENKDKNIVMVTSDKWIINAKGDKLFKKRFPGKGGFYKGTNAVKKTIRLGQNIIGEPGCPLLLNETVKKVEGVRMPKELGYVGDLDLWCRMLMLGNLFVIKEPLFYYRIIETSDSVKNQRWRQAKVFNTWVNSYMDRNIVRLSWFDKKLAFMSSWLICLARNIVYATANRKKK
ncbi:MAG: glycosyltransferase [Lentimicrobiaceae bacterium]|nr:glycosyltransferase [Lentimicrobiaceae bacterium]